MHSGEQAIAAGGVTGGLLDLHQQVTWRARHFYTWFSLTSRITAMDRPRFFQDAMLRGPFASMRHDHHFHALSPSVTEMRDVFTFAAPLRPLGCIAEVALLRRYMRALLRERNQVIRQIAESGEWRRYLTGQE
jgi:ligand-binding SRPBCC domain-containing protein